MLTTDEETIDCM